MKKKGMIGEKHRKSSEDKWASIIKAIDDGVPSVDIFDEADKKCGYCIDACERAGKEDMCGFECETCYMSYRICGSMGSGDIPITLVKKYLNEENMSEARKYAVKIYEYIKNDKPEAKG